jgi:hypothetical protein
MADPLPKYIVLVPLRYNDGRKVPEEVILEFQERLFAMGCGITTAGVVEGAYRMADGRKQIDHSLQLWIGVKDEYYPELERVVAELGHQLGQESMYLERTGATMHFIPPRSPKEVLP